MTDLHAVRRQPAADDAPWEPVEGRPRDTEPARERQDRLAVEAEVFRLNGARDPAEIDRYCDENDCRDLRDGILAAVREKRERDRQRRLSRVPS